MVASRKIFYYFCLLFILGLQSTEPEWYNLLTSNLTEQEQKSLMEVSVLADQRRAARESKKIEQQGGKRFYNKCALDGHKVNVLFVCFRLRVHATSCTNEV